MLLSLRRGAAVIQVLTHQHLLSGVDGRLHGVVLSQVDLAFESRLLLLVEELLQLHLALLQHLSLVL